MDYWLIAPYTEWTIGVSILAQNGLLKYQIAEVVLIHTIFLPDDGKRLHGAHDSSRPFLSDTLRTKANSDIKYLKVLLTHGS